MNDFRTLQFHISQHQMEPTQEEYWEEGYVVMRQCAAESQAILATHFNPGFIQGDHGDGEHERMQLQRFVLISPIACYLEDVTHRKSPPRIILDASTRRFQAHKIYLRAAAATRWASSRSQVLQGARPNGRHAAALAAINENLRLVSISSSKLIATSSVHQI
jgi:hypothetical protein